MKSTTDHTEARVFERNAARGARDVVMAWLLRKLVLPIGLVLLFVIAQTFHSNGILAAMPVTAILIGYVVWVGGIYRRNFLHKSPFQLGRSADKGDQ